MKKIDKIKEILSERLEYEEIPVVWEFILEQKSEIDKLNEMINNPKDLTLCKMWADTKLRDEVERLSNELNQQFIKCDKYMTRNEKAIEYIEESAIIVDGNVATGWTKSSLDKLYKILKGEDKK